MPIFTLRCERCGQEFDRFTWDELDAQERVCPNCASSDTKELWVAYETWENPAHVGCG